MVKAIKQVSQSVKDFVIKKKSDKTVSKSHNSDPDLKLSSKSDKVSSVFLDTKTNQTDVKHTKSVENGWSNRRIFMFWFIGVVCVYIWYISYSAISVIYMILTAFILSVAVESMIVYFSRLVGRKRAIAMTYLIILLLILVLTTVFSVFIIEQLKVIIWFVIDRFNNIKMNLSIDSITSWIMHFRLLSDQTKLGLVAYLQQWNYFTELQTGVQQNISNLTNILQSSVTSMLSTSTNSVYTGVGAVYNILWFVFNFGVVFVLSILFSLEKDVTVSFLSGLWGKENKPYRQNKINKIYIKMWDWLKWQLILCLIIWLMVGVSLWIVWFFGLTIPNILTIAFIAGMTEFIPYLWPTLGAMPAILVASIHYGWVGFLVVSLIFVVIQQTENNFLVPFVMKKALGISFTFIFISMLIWWVMLGILWILLAIPFAVIISTLMEDPD